MVSATFIVIIIALASIMVTTFILNGIVLLALTFGYRQQVTSTFSKTLTVSLVTADLLISLTLMPASLYEIVDEKWAGLLGEIVCRFFFGADIFLCTASVFHLAGLACDRYLAGLACDRYLAGLACDRYLAGLACDRYLAVCHPFVHRRLSVCWARVTCILFWLSSAAIGSSSLLTASQVETGKNFTESHPGVNAVGVSTCYLDVSFIYFGATILLCFVIPLTVMMGFHIAIILKVRTPLMSLPTDSRAGQTLGWKWVCPSEVSLEDRSAKTNISLSDDMTRDRNDCTQSNLQTTHSVQADHTELKTISQGLITEEYQGQTSSERIGTRGITLTSTKKQTGDRAMKTIACLVLCFVICWAPPVLLGIISGIGSLAVPPLIYNILRWLGYVNSTINPLLYYRYHKTIRKSIRSFLKLSNP